MDVVGAEISRRVIADERAIIGKTFGSLGQADAVATGRQVRLIEKPIEARKSRQHHRGYRRPSGVGQPFAFSRGGGPASLRERRRRTAGPPSPARVRGD